MKKNIVKNIIKMVATTAMVATLFIGTGKEAQAETRKLTVQEFASEMGLTVAEYKNFKSNGFLVSADGSVRGQTSVAYYFDHERYAADYPDLAAVLGLDATALRNHYYNCGMAEGRVAYSMDGTVIAAAGVATAQPAMLALVNADREANGVELLTWDAELEAVVLQRVLEVADNYRNSKSGHCGSEAYRSAYGIYGENVGWNYYSVSKANERWISSEGHHMQRLANAYQQYVAASYIDPATGKWTWIEVFR